MIKNDQKWSKMIKNQSWKIHVNIKNLKIRFISDFKIVKNDQKTIKNDQKWSKYDQKR